MTAHMGAARQKELAKKISSDFAERFYRVTKTKLFEMYEKFTKSETPDIFTNRAVRDTFFASWED
jgi:hypothetical protein